MKHRWKPALAAIALPPLLLAAALLTRAQSPGPSVWPYETSCPSGMSPMTGHTALDTATGLYVMTECVSSSGNLVVFNVASNSYSTPAGITVANAFTGTNTFGKINGICIVDGVKNPTLAAAVTCAGSSGVIEIPMFAAPALTANVTIVSGVTLWFNGPSGITTTGFTLTINGPVIAPPVQIFFGTGTVSLGPANSKVEALWFPGADLAAQINNAYAALAGGAGTNGGGIIHVPAGIFSNTNFISFNSAAKRAILQCDGIGVTVLKWPSISGAQQAVTFNNSSATDAYMPWGQGIRDCDIVGPGGVLGAGGDAGNGVLMQGGGVFMFSRAAGFALNFQYNTSAPAFGLLIFHSNFISCQSAGSKNALFNVLTENVAIVHSVFTSFCGAVANPNDVQLKGNGDYHVWNTSFDSSGLAIGGDALGGQYSFQSNHFEMGSGITNATADIPVTITSGQAGFSQDTFLYDPTAAGTGPPAEFLNNPGGASVSVRNPIYIHSGVQIAAFINSANPIDYENAMGSDPTIAGNHFTAAVTATGSKFLTHPSGRLQSSGSIEGSLVLSIQAATCSTTELALSAGWGTSPTVTSSSGLGQTCKWTITSGTGTPTANPTITDTLAVALPFGNILCRATFYNPAVAGQTFGIENSTQSAAAPVFTVYFTPAVSTAYRFERTCGP